MKLIFCRIFQGRVLEIYKKGTALNKRRPADKLNDLGTTTANQKTWKNRARGTINMGIYKSYFQRFL